MRAYIIIFLALVATVAYGRDTAGDGVIGSKNILRLSLKNPGDVYLVGNFLACVNAYSW